MATKEQKEQLVETLKFTPCDYRIEITGRGGEYVIGKVSREIYDYFQENDIDISDYAYGSDEDYEHVPEDMRPFTPGQWFECDEEFHEYGALSGLLKLQYTTKTKTLSLLATLTTKSLTKPELNPAMLASTMPVKLKAQLCSLDLLTKRV